MSVYDLEVGWAVSTQVDSLIKVLHEYKSEDINAPVIIRSTIASAPHNDSLFDSLVLFVKLDEDGTAHLRGTITEWSPGAGDTYYRYEIKSFPSFEELVSWFDKLGEARDYCKAVMTGKADSVEKQNLKH